LSIKLMNMVFERYPVGGNEGMLALAIADHSRDDGTRIWPSLDSLAKKTKQSRSSVRRHLRVMQLRGWLQLVRSSDGRAGGTNEYRINDAWIAGSIELPEGVPEGVNLEPSLGCEHAVENSSNGDPDWTGEGVTAVVGEGVIAVVPESSGTTNEPSLTPPPPAAAGGNVHKPEQPTPEPSARERQRWRWADRRSGIEERGEQLGIGRWDEPAFGRGGESFLDYAVRVFTLHAVQQGAQLLPADVRRMLEANANWSEVVRSLTTPATTNDNPRSDG
jgi:hypothetical protein